MTRSRPLHSFPKESLAPEQEARVLPEKEETAPEAVPPHSSASFPLWTKTHLATRGGAILSPGRQVRHTVSRPQCCFGEMPLTRPGVVWPLSFCEACDSLWKT